MLISFEGIDGTGKATQAILLQERLNAEGIDSVYFDFPAYESFVGKEIGSLLSSDSADKEHDALTLPPKLMAMLFSLDRMQFYKQITDAIAKKQVVITNRYSLSNSVFQTIRAGEDISKWVDSLEHVALGLPRPDFYIVFMGSLSASRKLVASKGARNYTESHDIYEKNDELLEKAQTLYSEIETPYSEKIIITCLSEGNYRTRDDIHEEIVKKIFPKMKFTNLEQITSNDIAPLISLSDKIWSECRQGYKLDISCIQTILESLSTDEYKNLESSISGIKSYTTFALIADRVKKRHSPGCEKSIELSALLSAISYSANAINDMINYPVDMREQIAEEICDTLNINRSEMISLDKEWGNIFYSA
ncbi:dTMP kinase [Methylomonas sp. MED-D]|uniref:dTMP kinase n=1 Tax=unclassified Methylomonas TaxID=2608980 RepID=UPI0028A53202|nr:hypothetical protein [Methylomonas sp. MV1]MDT4328798.1 hypothetical protein [Methylomonas sp. MV1]